MNEPFDLKPLVDAFTIYLREYLKNHRNDPNIVVMNSETRYKFKTNYELNMVQELPDGINTIQGCRIYESPDLPADKFIFSNL